VKLIDQIYQASLQHVIERTTLNVHRKDMNEIL